MTEYLRRIPFVLIVACYGVAWRHLYSDTWQWWATDFALWVAMYAAASLGFRRPRP